MKKSLAILVGLIVFINVNGLQGAAQDSQEAAGRRRAGTMGGATYGEATEAMKHISAERLRAEGRQEAFEKMMEENRRKSETSRAGSTTE